MARHEDVQRHGGSAHEVHLAQSSVVFVLVTLSGCVKCAGSTGDTQSGNTIEAFSVAADGDVLLVPVCFGGKKYSFMLDTGSDVTVCDESIRAELEKTRKPGGIELSLGTAPLVTLPAAWDSSSATASFAMVRR